MVVDNVFDTVITTIKTGDIKGLSEMGTKILNQFNNSIIDEIKEAGLANAMPIVKKYSSQLSSLSNLLDDNQIAILKTELDNIPDTLINSALRK